LPSKLISGKNTSNLNLVAIPKLGSHFLFYFRFARIRFDKVKTFEGSELETRMPLHGGPSFPPQVIITSQAPSATSRFTSFPTHINVLVRVYFILSK
jgi:hypothetical protein